MPHEEPPAGRFADAALVAELDAWIDRSFGRLGIAATGPTEQVHDRPWSSALRCPTDAGTVWCKLNGPGTAHEAATVGVLHDLAPGLVPSVLAHDVGRGWWLASDCGVPLRDAHGLDPWTTWASLLADHAAVQLRVAGHEEAVLVAGVPVTAPETLPGQFRELLDELSDLAPDDGGLDAAGRVDLEALVPSVEEWCAELVASGIPTSIQHDDLHAGNACVDPGSGAVRVIDWGDAYWGCPLSLLLVTLGSLAAEMGCAVDDPRIARLRDAYLEPFTGLASRAELTHAVESARRVGHVARALSWRRGLEGVAPAAVRELQFPVRAWLLELVSAP